MFIKKIVIKNYKKFKNFELDFDKHLNIIVGDNESGKSTLLEAIHLALTKQINGRYIDYELSPYIFNKEAVKDYIQKLKEGQLIALPEVLIELYFNSSNQLASLEGTNNTKKEYSAGIYLRIRFNDDFTEDYKDYLKKPDDINVIPIEFFKIEWFSFANNAFSKRSLPIKTLMIDTTLTRLYNGTDYFIYKAIEEVLEPKERANLSLLYRNLKELFAQKDAIKDINERLKKRNVLIPDKDLSISIDISQKTDWSANLTSYLDDIPFKFIGKGDQTIIKMLIALEKEKAQISNVVLVEEPENHLSYSTMNMLIKMISEKCSKKQLFITTHSTFVLNKLGLENVILLGDSARTLTLEKLSGETQRFFKKLPGYDTLRLLLAKKAILVEGPSDELIVQKAYLLKYEKLPIEDEIDIISVGLSFKRFLEIAKILNKDVAVVTDNDGNCDALMTKYEGFWNLQNIKICYDKNDENKTLEVLIVKNNELNKLNRILGSDKTSKSELIEYMIKSKNKTECALKIFETEESIVVPEYINAAIK